LGFSGDAALSWEELPWHLQEAVTQLASLDPEAMLRRFVDLLLHPSDTGSTTLTVELSERLLELAGGVPSARFSGAPSARFSGDAALVPALVAAHQRRFGHIRFVTPNETLAEIAEGIASATSTNLFEVHRSDPFARADRSAHDVETSEGDVEIAFPAFGVRPDMTKVDARTQAALGNAPSGRITSEAVAVADAMTHYALRKMLCLPSAFLVRQVGIEAAIRKEMSWNVSFVAAVPARALYPALGVPMSFVMIDRMRKDTSVTFLDLGSDRYCMKGPRGRPVLRTDKSWRDAIEQGETEGATGIAVVPWEKIRARDPVLAVDRYVDTQAGDALTAFADTHESSELIEVVDIHRPLALTADEEGEVEVLEAAPRDLGSRGYVTEPEKRFRVGRVEGRRAENQQLLPGDVVLSVKGTIGNVAIVPDEAPPRGSKAIWTAGQALMILRPRRASTSPAALWAWLSSDVMRAHLEALAKGGVVPNLSSRDLKTLPIVLPSAEDRSRVEEAFARRQALYDEIDHIEAEIKALQKGTWPQNELRLNEGDDA
jgi:hypothetical protein